MSNTILSPVQETLMNIHIDKVKERGATEADIILIKMVHYNQNLYEQILDSNLAYLFNELCKKAIAFDNLKNQIMTKETIPQSIIDKINTEYPLGSGRYSTSFRGFNKLQEARREAAIWGYGLSEGRIKELEEKWERLYKDFKSLDEYNTNLREENIRHKKALERVNLSYFDYMDKVENKIKELEASDKWISVKDGLPEDLEDVLACHIEAGGIQICYYSHEDKKWWATDDNDGHERIITHYQYLPKPPKDI